MDPLDKVGYVAVDTLDYFAPRDPVRASTLALEMLALSERYLKDDAQERHPSSMRTKILKNLDELKVKLQPST